MYTIIVLIKPLCFLNQFSKSNPWQKSGINSASFMFKFNTENQLKKATSFQYDQVSRNNTT